VYDEVLPLDGNHIGQMFHVASQLKATPTPAIAIDTEQGTCHTCHHEGNNDNAPSMDSINRHRARSHLHTPAVQHADIRRVRSDHHDTTTNPSYAPLQKAA
jgi:hypothetical protein